MLKFGEVFKIGRPPHYFFVVLIAEVVHMREPEKLPVILSINLNYHSYINKQNQLNLGPLHEIAVASFYVQDCYRAVIWSF